LSSENGRTKQCHLLIDNAGKQSKYLQTRVMLAINRSDKGQTIFLKDIQGI
jgi:hypothetical protein